MSAKRLFACLTVALAALVLTGCPSGPDPVPVPDPTTVEVGQDEMVFDWFCSSQFLSVMSNGYWTVSSDQPWLTLMVDGGTGNQEIMVMPTDNPGSEARTARLTVSAGGVSRVVTVRQDPPVTPVSVKFHLGNIDSRYDSYSAVIVKFNKPVETLDVETFDINPQYTFTDKSYYGVVSGVSRLGDDEVGVHFTTRPDIINNFKFVIRNSFGHEETVLVYVPTYERRFTLEGEDNRIESMQRYADGRELLVRTHDRMLRIDSSTGEVVRSFGLPSSYGTALSPYDGRLYYWIPDKPALYSMDMESGESVTVHTFAPEYPDDIYPNVNPIALGLVSDGTGVVALRAKGVSGYPRMMFVDTRGGEFRVEEFPDDVSLPDQTFKQVCHNFDFSKLYMCCGSSIAVYSDSDGVRSFDQYTGLMYDTLRGLYPSLVDDRLLVRMNSELFVLDLESDTRSPMCALDGRTKGGAGMSYLKGYEDYAYVCDGDGASLSVVDTSTGALMGRANVGGFTPGTFFTDPSGRAFAYRNYAFLSTGEYGFAPVKSEYNFNGSAIYVFDNQVFNTAGCPDYNPDGDPFQDYFDLDFFVDKAFTYKHVQS